MRDCLETADPNQHPCFGVNGDSKSLKVAQDQLLLGSLPGHAQTHVAEQGWSKHDLHSQLKDTGWLGVDWSP